MLYNYFIIAFRNLLKNKVFSLINIVGLAIGITCCILLALFIKHEFSYERHFKDYESIYRVTSTFTTDKGSKKVQCTAPPTGPTFQQEFPEIEMAVRVASPPDVQRHYIRYEDKGFYENKGFVVDSTFFDLFSYEFEVGDHTTALDGPSAVVLSHSLAHKLFDGKPALDELLIIKSGFVTDTFRVTGVLKSFVNASQLDAGFYMGMNNKGWGKIINSINDWAQTFLYTFVKLKPDVSVSNLIAKFPKLMETHGAKELKAMGFTIMPGLQPLKDMHLYSVQGFATDISLSDIGTSGNIMSVYIMSSICIFILLIACINFINLTTAKAFKRAGEVGVRKSLGANRNALIWQFLGESLTITMIAMILSAVLVQMALPVFNLYTLKNLSISIENIGYVIVSLVGVSLITGFISGSYPAFFLSAFQPARVLKEKYLTGNSSNWLRQSLVVFQFVISISLISSILVIRKQINFVHQIPLGFNPEYKITLPLETDEAKGGYLNLKDRFKQLAGVSEVAASSALPSTQTVRGLPLYTAGSSAEHAEVHYWVNIDEEYFKMLGINLLKGRNLNETDATSFGTPLTNVLVNEASLKANNIKLDEAIGTKLHVVLMGQPLTFQITGVVENFHQFSMHRKVTPMMFQIPSPRFDYTALCVSVNASNYESTLSAIKKIWKELIPNTTFEHSLLSDNIKQQYDADQRVFTVITIFTVMAIIISCLGLYGLSIFTAERRVKEIGIRKVLGASVLNIVNSLSLNFVKLIGIAFLLAIPVGYYSMTKWLENFEYKIDVDFKVFLIAGITSLIIALVTIGFEAIKAALGNPVDSLRSE